MRNEPGAPYYGGPSHAQPTGTSVEPADIGRVRARQRELGVPESFEWLAHAVPDLRARMEAEGCAVLERRLMELAPGGVPSLQPPPDGVTIRTLDADDPALPAALAVPHLAFAAAGTAVGTAGRAELAALAEGLAADGTLEAVRPVIRAGHKRVVAAVDTDGSPLAVGQYHPAGGTTEIGGVGTLPAARRKGLDAAVTAVLAGHVREEGVRSIFLAYADDAVARIYARLGFRPSGTTLLIADQPARS